MKACCDDKVDELALLRARQGKVLKAVLAINAIMFVIEATAGWLSNSTALLADSLDMFGDAAVYALTLYVLDRGRVWRARAAFAKGAVMGIFGIGVMAQAVVKLVGGVTPDPVTMGGVGALALTANLGCLLLLYRHRTDDINMRSTWLCSRNDIIANIGVLAAAAIVALVHSNWPDIVVGGLIAGLFLKDAVAVLRDSVVELRGSQRLPGTSDDGDHVADPKTPS